MATAEKTAARLIEDSVPFSSSILWSWMKAYYTEGGVAVWTGGDIPFHITNTPLLAQEWMQTIFTLMRDFQRQGMLDPDHPIEVTELGPGTGRHAYFLLRELERAEQESKLIHPRGFRFTLRLAELGVKGLQSLSEHAQLKPYIESGRLILSRFDLGTDGEPSTWPEPAPRPPSPNPVFVIANYVLDSLPYDVVRFEDQSRSLGRATVLVKGLRDDQDPRELVELGEKIDLKFSFPDQPLKFDRPDWNEVLERYSRELDDTYLPFPSGAMAFLDRLRDWSQCASVLLVADKSFVDIEQLRSLEEPELVPHGGGFSFNANLHALSYLAEIWGGQSWHTSARDGTLDLSHLILPARPRSFSEPFLEMAYRMRRLESFHSVDRFRIKESVDEVVTRPNVRLSLDLLRLSGFDPQVFYEVSDHLLNGLDREDVDEETEAELRSILEPCLEAVFPVGDDVDMAFEVGRVAYRMELYELSEKAFHLSIDQFGEDAKTHFNLGLGWFYQGLWSKAEPAFARALELDPSYSDALEWMKKTQRRAKAANAVH